MRREKSWVLFSALARDVEIAAQNRNVQCVMCHVRRDAWDERWQFLISRRFFYSVLTFHPAVSHVYVSYFASRQSYLGAGFLFHISFFYSVLSFLLHISAFGLAQGHISHLGVWAQKSPLAFARGAGWLNTQGVRIRGVPKFPCKANRVLGRIRRRVYRSRVFLLYPAPLRFRLRSKNSAVHLCHV